MLKPDERIDQLDRWPVKIIQSPNVFSFSTDAALLADFAKVPVKGKIVDLCSGNGAVGLFLATTTTATIILVEIQAKLAEMAQRSIELNHLSPQVVSLKADAKVIDQQLLPDSIDYITCNPPYFPIKYLSKRNPNPYLAIARHELKITLADIFQVSSHLLKMGGKLALVIRPERLDDIFTLSQKNHLAIKRIRFVYPKVGKESNAVLIEAINHGRPNGIRILPPLYVRQGQAYTAELEQIIHGKPKQ